MAVATACIYQDDKVLLLRRSARNKHFRGRWQLPEGKLENTESSTDALLRELGEELRCTPSSTRFLGRIKTSIILQGRKIEVERSIFYVVLRDVAIQLSSEHDGLVWMSPSFVKKLALYPGTLEALEVSIDHE